MTTISNVLQEWETHSEPTFGELSDSVRTTHDFLQTEAIKAINQRATLRNWLIGCYIVEYEQKGKDRAEYGTHLLERLEKAVNRKGLKTTLFKNCRKFYNLYPQVADLFTGIRPTALDESSEGADNTLNGSDLQIRPTALDEFKLSPKTLISRLSFAHITEIMKVDDPMARYFYETESIKCQWSSRELHRQIVTNLYFRSGLSKNPEALLKRTNLNSNSNALEIREPYMFEFLGLRAKDVITEGDLENALIDHLQELLLEFGNGFCFEARQKRIIIDDQYYFADLVFYSRPLHCNVIIELKNDEFKHEYLGQLNAYVSYYRENEMHEGDNPPVGILLCTHKGKKMVEYALAGMDNQLFVSTYMLQLPDKSTLEKFLLDEIDIQE